jgi:hypothetical protein
MSLAKSIMYYIHRKPKPLLSSPIDPGLLSDLAVSFHTKAGTAMPWVGENIRRLAAGAPRIRVAHQANLFPSLGVVAQFILLDSLAQELVTQWGIVPAQMFVIVDYDVAGDSRFRVAHIPDVQRAGGSLSLSDVVPKDAFQKPMWAIPKPPVETVKKWVNQIYSLIDNDLTMLKKINITEREPGTIRGNFKSVEQLVWTAFERASTLLEFNAFALSHIVNVHWKMPVAFIFGRGLQPLMNGAYEELIATWPTLSNLARDGVEFFNRNGVSLSCSGASYEPKLLPFWISCNTYSDGQYCSQRVPLYAADQDYHLAAYAKCQRCHTQYEFDLGTSAGINLESLSRFVISPRILLDNFLDVVALGICGGSGYLGQAEHMLLANYVATKMNWEMPPHCLWRPRGLYYSPAECRAAYIHAKGELGNGEKERADDALHWVHFGKASTIYYLLNQGFTNLLSMWNDFLAAGQPVYCINDGQTNQHFQIPTEFVLELKALKMRD